MKRTTDIKNRKNINGNHKYKEGFTFKNQEN